MKKENSNGNNEGWEKGRKKGWQQKRRIEEWRGRRTQAR
jgi:hypothetical protein